ncbi:MATE family efflux transporter [Gemella cuniculi]|uniref:MATE family efflux transporter n=1 Tax=Gemella cuniculi TaxID=150240 RepID=UPI00041C7B82|nr:MATE family efflux transporter [Gemella cuniculi]
MNDMTHGAILSKILHFSIFIFIGGLLQNLYLIIDSIILGHYVGESGIAVVGIASPINFIAMGFLIGTAYGFGVIMAKSFGAGNFKEFRKYFFNSIILSFIIGILFTIILSLVNSNILNLINTPSELFNEAHRFLFILYLGCASTLIYNLFAATLRSIGNSFTPVLFLLLSVAINGILAYIFVALLNFGVEGSAFATIIAQATSAICCYFYINHKYPELRLTKEDTSLDFNFMKALLLQGVPMGMQFSFTGIGLIVLQKFLNGFGTNYIAGYSIGVRIQNIVSYIYVALGTAVSTFISQNIGAKKMYRISKAVRSLTITTIGCAILSMIIIRTFGASLITLFTTEPNEELTQATLTYFNNVTLAYIPLAILILYRNALQGYGFPITAMMAGIVELVNRVIIVIFFTDSLGFIAICYADSINWVITAIFLLIVYFITIKIHKRKYGEFYKIPSYEN